MAQCKIVHDPAKPARYCYSLGNVDRSVEFCWFDCLILEETDKSCKIRIEKWSFSGADIKWVRKTSVFELSK